MKYDYALYDRVLTNLLIDSLRDPDNLVIGENISDVPEIKITFEGYGDLEEEIDGEYVYTEGGNTNMESYAIFLHKNTLKDDFEFPEHDVYAFTFGRIIGHRPKEEVCIYGWYDVENDVWDILPLEDRLSDDNEMTVKDVMKIIRGLNKRYYE
jgi:hypothetical protein